MMTQPMLVTKMNKFIITLLLITPIFTSAQVVSDAKLWTGVTISKKVDDFNFSFKNQVRFNENMSHIYKLFTDIGADYKLTKGLYVGANYRFNRFNYYESKNYELYHRFSIGISYKHKVEQFRFTVKNKLQHGSAKGNKVSTTFNRTKFVIAYKANDQFTPYASYEIFYSFNIRYIVASRLALGGKFKINDNNSIKTYYFFGNSYNVKNLKHNHVWGITYNIKL